MFGFGGGRSRSNSQSQSSSFGASRSDSFSGGFSRGGSEAGSTQRIAFEDVFARLFGGAESAAAGLDPSLLTQSANQLFSGGIDFLDSIGGDAGTDFLTRRISGESPVLDEQIDALSDDLSRFYSEELLPGITSDAVASGTLGGGRQGVAQGLAAERVAGEFTRGVTELRSRDIAARDAAAATIAGNALTGTQLGVGALPSLYGLSEASFGAELAPYQALAGILGPQTTLTESASSSFQTAEDFARAFSRAFNQSQASSSSSSDSKSFTFRPFS